MFAQGINTTAAKDDWEEINFEFDSDILVDGFPSLLRLGELLNQNPTHRLALTGHADYRGSDQYNVDLSRRRANAVREFLIKYGANDNQIVLEPQGETIPRVDQRSP
jgi:peptidoglycan-associated lipoprotein